MEQILALFSSLPEMILALEVALVALIAFFILIPGKQPEESLQKLVDLIKKISKK